MLKRLLSIPLIECKGTTRKCFLVIRFLIIFLLFSLKPFFSLAQFPYEESFRNDFTNRPVIFGGSPNIAFLTAQTPPLDSKRTFDVMGQGFLQLTNNGNFQTGYVYSNDVFPGTYGLHIELDYFTHGGNGADGISFFLFDAAVPANAFTIGAFGGSLGYSQRAGIDGVSGGYLGIGLDEYGNFSNSGEGRVGGVSNSQNTLYPNRVSLRGNGNGQSQVHNYEYLTSAATLVDNVGFPIAGDNRDAVPNDPTYRKLIIDLAPKTLGNPANGIIINVSIQHGGTNSIAHLIQDFPYPVAIPAAGLKYGLSSSTGGSTNFHEIRGLEMTVNPNFLIQPVAKDFSGSNCQRQTIVIPDFLKNADRPNAQGAPTPGSVMLAGSPLTYTKQGVGVFSYDITQDAIIFVPDPDFVGTSTIPYTYTDFYGKVSTVANITVTTVTPTVAPLTGDVTICASQTFNSSVSVVGSVSSLKWQFRIPGAGPDDWNDVVLGNGTSVASGNSPSGVTNTLTITNVPAGSNGYQYRALITPLAGGQCANVPSNPVTLTVNALPVATISPSTSACLKSPDVPVVFTGSNGVAPYTFTYTVTSVIGGVTTVSNVLTATTSSTDPTFIAKQSANNAGTFTYNILSVTGSSTSCVNTQGVQSTVVVNPIPAVAISPLSQSVCEGSAPIPITFTGSGGTGPFVISYTLTSTTATGTVKSDVLTVTTDGSNPFILMQQTTVPGTFTYDVLSILNTSTNCSFTPRQFSVESTIVIIPNATMVAAPESGAVNPAVCVGTPMVPIIFNVKDARTVSGEANPVAPGVTWNFDPVKMQVTISGTPTAVGTFSYDFSTLGGCSFAEVSGKIIVNPLATVDKPADQLKCNQTATDEIVFSGNLTQNTYNWVNSNTAIGLADHGTGNIESFTTTNNTNAPVEAIITVTPVSISGCTGTPVSFKITVNPTVTVNSVPDQVKCNGVATDKITFSGTVAQTIYNWRNDHPEIGLADHGTGDIDSFTATNTTGAPIVATITVTPALAVGCPGTPVTFTITVKPTATVNHVADQVYCNGIPVTAFPFGSNVATTTYTWTNNNTAIGLAASGTGSLPVFTATNTTGVPVTATITVTPVVASADGCAGVPVSFMIIVKPTANVNAVANEVYCNNESVTSAAFGSNVATTTYTWTNSNTAIGLGASGTGSLPVFTATNTTGVPVTATITVTPVVASADGCAGVPVNFTIIVKPTANVNAVANEVYCNNESVTSAAFGSNVATTTYTWTNSNTAIGLAASGTGSLPVFTATNTTGVPVTATITVTPVVASTDGCAGVPVNFMITVKPTANVNAVANEVYCNNESVTSAAFGSNVATTTYTWTNSNTAIGLGASGTGSLPVFTATNTTGVPVTATITVTPVVASADGCAGVPVNFTIIVKPTANVNAVANEVYCNNESVTSAAFGSNVGTTTYTWTNNNTAIGLGASGTGSLPVFTATNTTGVSITATITVTPVIVSADGCAGNPITFTITVKPTANVNAVANEVYCNNESVTSSVFGSNVATTTYTWTNSNTAIGLGASGTGSLPVFTATNTTGVPITATITVTPVVASADGCAGVPVTFTITVKPTATVNHITDQVYCNGILVTAFPFGSNVATTTYTWTNSNTAIGLADHGTGGLPAFTATNTTGVPIISTITVTPLIDAAVGCAGPAITFTITVKPTANVNAVANETYCNNESVTSAAFGSNVATTTYTWTNSNIAIGLGASSTGSLPVFTATNTTGVPITATITITPVVASADGCAGVPVNFMITVKPTANVNAVANEVYCNNESVTSAVFGSNVATTTYTWTNSNTDIGLGASGTGSLPVFTATNTTDVPITATITVTPVVASTNGCAGNPITFTITVKPTANVNTIANETYCNNESVTSAAFGSNVGATTYTWTNNNTAIGLGASGTGSLPVFTATNTTGVPITATITVTPVVASADGCAGVPVNFMITVKPTANVNAVANEVYCNNESVTSAVFGSNVGTTTYTWTNNNTAIGLGASGTGSLPVFTATNTTGVPITATITVTPVVASTNGCAGNPITFTITVKPTANVNTIANETYCNNESVTSAAFGSNVATTTYTWTNSNIAIGLGASGTGSLPVFTATNTTGVPITATITVTPVIASADGCAGVPVNFTITVKPTANVNAVANETYCNNQSVTSAAFGSNVGTTTYTWTNSNIAIGLGASGTGSLPVFTTTNTTSLPIISTITVTPSVASADGCAGPAITFTITVNPTATVNHITDQVYCNGIPVTAFPFSSNIAATTYTWTNSNTAIGLAAQGTGNLPAFTATNTTGVPIISIITVTPAIAADGCAGPAITFTITVNPTAKVNPVANVVYCNNQSVTSAAFGSNVASTTYTWTNSNTAIGLGASGTGNLPVFTATNTTGVPITATITVTPVIASADGCAGQAITFTITVDPTAKVNPVANETYCNNQSVTSAAFSSNVAATTYTWTNSNTAIGLGASGTGNLSVFTAINTTGVPITATITVTPVVASTDGCAGNPITFTITVNPTAKVNPVANEVYCNNQPATSVVFGSNVTATTFTWTNSNAAIGLAVQGTGNLPAFTATNTTGVPITATITVTPVVASADGCAGNPTTFTITVNPTSKVNPVVNQTYCNNQSVTSAAFGSNVAATTYTWTNSNTAIGLSASGTGSLPVFTAINTTGVPVTATITVTPVIASADGCAGNPVSFTITVNPTANVNTIPNATYCTNQAVTPVAFSSNVTATTYTWTNSNTAIGLGASGTGNLPTFTTVNTTGVPVTATITVTPVIANGCAGEPVTFTITVNPATTLQLTSAPSTKNQVICLGSSIQPVAYTFTNSAITISNLPAGLTTATNNGIFTISGTPTQPGVLNYAITATGTCNTVQVSGTITINPLPIGFNDIASDLTCTNNTLNYNLQDNINNTAKGGNSIPSSFSWTAAPNTNITGTTNASGNTINDKLINTSGVTQQVIYTITPVSLASGCPGKPFTLTVNVLPCIGLSITKTADVTSVSKVGDQIKYSITVTNTATANHTNVKVTDPFLGGLLSGPASGDNGNGILEAGESWVYTGTYTVTQNDLDNNGKPSVGSGKIINTATVNSTEHPDLLSASSTVDLQTISGINLVKTGIVDGSGSVIIFKFKITNTGTVTLKNISLTDPYLGGTINLGITTLAPGQSETISVSYTIKQADRDNGKVINTATVKGISSGGGEVTDVSGTEMDNDTPTTVIVGNHPAITLIKSGVISTDKKTIVYSFKITNTGNVTLTNIDLKDSKITGAIILGKYTLEPGETVTGTATYTITDDERLDGRVSNTATVTGDTFNGVQVKDISGTQANNDDPTLHIIDDTPQAMDDVTSTKINEPVTYDITHNDIPSVNGLDKSTIRITRYPSNGTVRANSDGTMTYTPDKGYSGTDDFTYTVSDRAGKPSNNALVRITVIPTPIFIPNTFTPNGDGKNDTFQIIGRDAFDNTDVLIFNRWGNEVYRSKNYQDEWDGSGLNEGTYYYLITFKKGATSITKKGWILLKR